MPSQSREKKWQKKRELLLANAFIGSDSSDTAELPAGHMTMHGKNTPNTVVAALSHASTIILVSIFVVDQRQTQMIMLLLSLLVLNQSIRCMCSYLDPFLSFLEEESDTNKTEGLGVQCGRK